MLHAKDLSDVSIQTAKSSLSSCTDADFAHSKSILNASIQTVYPTELMQTVCIVKM